MKQYLILFCLLCAPGVLANTLVDQGRPGTQGSWWTRLSTTATNPVQDASTATYTPAVTSTNLVANATACTAAGGASCTIVFASTEVIGYPNFTISIRNSGANTIEDVNVLFSPDGTNFYVYDGTGAGGQTFTTLLTGQLRALSFQGNSQRYLRIEARASANTSISVHFTANQG